MKAKRIAMPEAYGRPTGAALPAAGWSGDESLRAFLVVLLTFVLGFVVPALLFWHSDDYRVTGPVLLVWGVTAYAGARLASISIAGQKRLLSLTFWIFVYVWMGLAPLLQLASGELPLPGMYDDFEWARSTLLVFFGLVAFEVGFALSARAYEFGFRVIRGAMLERRIVASRMLVSSAAALVLLLAIVSWVGGWRTLSLSRVDFILRALELLQAEGQAPILIFSSLLRVPICIVFFLVLYAWAHRTSPEFSAIPRVVWAALALFLGAVTVLVNNPFNAARHWVGTILLGSLFLLLPSKSRFSLPVLTCLLVLALLFLFPNADVFRSEIDAEQIRELQWGVNLHTMDFDAFQQLTNAGRFVDGNGIRFGSQALGAVLFWVPRSFWSNKPAESGHMVALDSGYFYTNLSMPLWGEAYLDGGYVMLALVFVAYGFYLGKVERVYVRGTPLTGTAGAIGVPIFAAYQLFFLRGALTSAVAYLAPIIAFLLVCTATARKRPRPADAQAPARMAR